MSHPRVAPATSKRWPLGHLRPMGWPRGHPGRVAFRVARLFRSKLDRSIIEKEKLVLTILIE